MQNGNSINVGIGFATGRKNFQRILKTNIQTWKESGLVDNKKISLNLFVAYDLSYNKTKISDYTNMHQSLVEQIDSSEFIGTETKDREVAYLIRENVLTEGEALLIFNRGYAAKRNAVLYSAIKKNMDCVIFLDDDEYPMAVTNSYDKILWGGQHILYHHLNFISQADITYGYHCGYISPIPYLEFNSVLSQSTFRSFIEAISNDIINWETLKNVMKNGGVTYAEKKILASKLPIEIQEVNHAKFISGSNLCINLSDPCRVFPFYNPPNARGEDTFLGTCLGERKVLRVPVYAFHDGFSTYNDLLHGVLPIRLKFIKADTEKIKKRFYKACIGWIRYKPLLLYITDSKSYEEKIDVIRNQLNETLPQICAFFDDCDFMNILVELEKYNRNVKKHYENFLETQRIWSKIMRHFASINQNAGFLNTSD